MLQFSLIYFIWHLIYQSTTNLSHVHLPILRRRTPKGINNPFNTSGCEDLLYVCRGCLRCFACFSYWFDHLGFISEGNTNIASSDIKRNFWRRCRGGSRKSKSTIPSPITIPISRITLFSICLLFCSPPLHPCRFIRPLFPNLLLSFRLPFFCLLVCWITCCHGTR